VLREIRKKYIKGEEKGQEVRKKTISRKKEEGGRKGLSTAKLTLDGR